MNNYWSRIPGFFKFSMQQRRACLEALPCNLDYTQWQLLDQGLSLSLADRMSENVIGTFSLPFAVAPNFIVDEESVLVPLVTEEPSVVAALTKMAKLVSLSGGFKTRVDEQIQKGQIQVYNLNNIKHACEILVSDKENIIIKLNRLCPSMVKRGGGIVDLTWRVLYSPRIGPMLMIEPLIDVKEAMGANIVNSVLEGIKPYIENLLGGIVNLCILSNLCDTRLAHSQCFLYLNDISLEVAERMIAAQALAEVDIYRATTHNKGILNGIDALALATGNDFRALEAGAHAYASKDGNYGPLTRMHIDTLHKRLCAEITIPIASGVVGGSLQINNGVRVAHKILGDFALTNKKLAALMASVGLAQCLAALMALCSEGIQRGHMALHNKKTLIHEPLHAY